MNKRIDDRLLGLDKRTFVSRLVAGVLLLNLFTIGMAVWSIKQNFELHHEQAQISTQNLVLSLESELLGQIRANETAMYAVQDEFYRQRAQGRVDAAVLNDYIEQVRERLPDIDAIRITDAQGLLLFGTDVKAGARVSLADRPHFITLRDHADAGLAFSKVQVSRVNQRKVIVLARRLEDGQGRFAGMVFAAVPLDRLTGLFSTLNVGRHGTVAMRDEEMALLVRHPESPLGELAQGSKKVSPEIRSLLAVGKTEGTFLSASTPDKVERMVSFRKVGDHPLYVITGRATRDYLADTYRDVWRVAGLLGVFVLVTSAISFIIYLGWRRQRQLNLALRDSEMRLNELFENMHSGVAVYRTPDDGQTFFFSGFNRTAERIENMRRDDVLGRNVVEVFPGIAEIGLLGAFQRVWKSGLAEDFPLSFYHDGRITGWRENYVYKLPSGELVSIYDDATERMQTQQLLEQLNRDFVTLLESTSDFIYFKDKESRIRFCSQSMAVITGNSNWRDMVGKHDIEIFPAETARIYYEEELPVFRDGVPLLNKTDPYFDADGNRCWVNTNKWPVFDDEGKTVVGLFGISRDITDRIHAEEALRRSEELFRAIADKSPLAIYMSSGIEQRAEYINATFVHLFGYTMAEVPTVNEWWPRAYPDEAYRKEIAAEWQRRVAEAIEKQTEIEPMETSVTCKDGSLKYVSWGFISIGEQNWAFGLDLTERKRAEQEVQFSMDKLNEAQRIARVGNWELDLLSGQLFWSDEIFNLFEIDKACFEASYEAFLNAIHPDDREAVNQAYTRSLETREPYEITHRLLMADGRIKWVNERCETYYDEQGKPLRSAGTVQDVTERKKVEDQLQESENFLRTIIASEPECIKIVDEHGMLEQMNPAGLAMIEADTLEQVAGRPVLGVIAPEYREAFAEMHKRVLEGESVRLKFEVLGLKGGRRMLESHAVPMMDHGRRVHLAVTRDITEKQKVEDELRRSNTDLERFAYSVSHDMRQPLRAISGHLQLLQRSLKDKLDDDERQNMAFALDGARRMDSMIVSLLEYSRVGRKTEAKGWQSGRDGLDEALGFLRPMIVESSAQVNVSGEWPHVFVSRDEMTRLFQNLVSNGLKYCEAGQTPQVEIVSGVAADVWQVRVRDHGIGIDPAQAGRLFQFFSRLQSRTRFEGNGMGLALCRRILEHHGGRIWAESAGEGQGSTFCFEIPLADARKKEGGDE
ncbi:MAG: PAS domain S-box protein [Gallionella sp.]|nr:PAS domain S-box protein [Gallionella sp.]